MSDEIATSATAGDAAPDAHSQAAGAAGAAEVVRDAIVRAPAAVLSDDDTESYAALNNAAVFFDIGPRHVSMFTGEKAVERILVGRTY